MNSHIQEQRVDGTWLRQEHIEMIEAAKPGDRVTFYGSNAIKKVGVVDQVLKNARALITTVPGPVRHSVMVCDPYNILSLEVRSV